MSQKEHRAKEGARYGLYVVQQNLGKHGKFNQYRSLVCCICGEEREIFDYSLVRPNGVKACRSCAAKRRWSNGRVDLTGRTINNLQVIKEIGTGEDSRFYYEVQCKRCGKKFRIERGNLIRRNSAWGCFRCTRRTRKKDGDGSRVLKKLLGPILEKNK